MPTNYQDIVNQKQAAGSSATYSDLMQQWLKGGGWKIGGQQQAATGSTGIQAPVGSGTNVPQTVTGSQATGATSGGAAPAAGAAPVPGSPTGGYSGIPSPADVGVVNPNVQNPNPTGPLDPNQQYQALLQALGLFNSVVPGFEGTLNPQQGQLAGYGTDIMKILGGVLFGNDRSTGLGSTEGGAPLGMAGNLGMVNYLQGAGRGQLREGLLGQLASNASSSPQASLGGQLADAGERLTNPGLQMDRFTDMEAALRADNARSLNATRNRLQDLGLASGGMGQAPALMAAESASSRSLNDALLALENFKAQEARQNLAAATQAGAASTDIYNALKMAPSYQIASSLAGPQNVQSNEFIDQLERMAQLAQGVALTNRSPSTWEKLAPLLGGGLQAGGSILGGALSRGFGGGGGSPFGTGVF